jgi:hypothetical protein
MNSIDQRNTAHYWRMHFEEPGSDRPPKEKRERSWPFLTWPFFLAQLLMMKDVLALNVSNTEEAEQQPVKALVNGGDEGGAEGAPILAGLQNNVEADESEIVDPAVPSLAGAISPGDAQVANPVPLKSFIPAEVSGLASGGGGGGGSGGRSGSRLPGQTVEHEDLPGSDRPIAPPEIDHDGGGEIGKPDESGGLEPEHGSTIPPIGSGGLLGSGLEIDISAGLPPAVGGLGLGLEASVSVVLPAAAAELGLVLDTELGSALGTELRLTLDTNIEFGVVSILGGLSMETTVLEANAQLDLQAGVGSLAPLATMVDAVSGDLRSLDSLSTNLDGISPALSIGSPLIVIHDLPLQSQAISLVGLENSFNLVDLLGPEFVSNLDQQLVSSALQDIGLQGAVAIPQIGIGERAAAQSTMSDASLVSDAADFAGLQVDGVVSSGETFDFMPSPVSFLNAQLNELFSGSAYTDYNVVLQNELASSLTVPTQQPSEPDTELQHITLQQLAADTIQMQTPTDPAELPFTISPEELSIRAISI